MTIKYHEMVAALVKPGQAILDSLTPAKTHLMHMAIGISGEVAELMDGLVTSKGRENVIEELGDLAFFIEGFRQGCDISEDGSLNIPEKDLENLISGYYTDNPVAGLSVAAGSLLDAVKKHVIYNKPLDRAEVVRWLTVIMLHMAMIGLAEGISHQEAIDANIYKLALGPNARYKGGSYSDKAAQERADKSATVVMPFIEHDGVIGVVPGSLQLNGVEVKGGINYEN